MDQLPACAPHCNDPLPGALTAQNLLIGKVVVALVLALVVLVVILWRRRAHIAKAADNVAVATIAKGIGVKRRWQAKRNDLARRANERADGQ